MAVTPPDHSREIRAALREVVSEYGPDALSRPATMSNLLKDLLPDAPRVTRMLVTAAEDRIADTLRDHVAQGMDPATAARLTASFFASATMFTPDVCAWVVGEFAIALGLIPEAGGSPTVTVPPWAELVVSPSSPSERALGQPPGPPADATRRPAPQAVPSGAGEAGGRLSELMTIAPDEGHPAGHAQAGTLYVASEADGTVTPVDLGTGAIGAPIKAGNLPRSIAITPDRARAYVVSYGDGTVTPISLPAGIPGAAIRAGDGPLAIAITADGKIGYVASEGDGTVIPIDLAAGTPGVPIPVGKRPYAIAITPDGKTAYVANHGDGTVTPISLPAGTPSTPVRVGNGPVAIAITPDGKTAYVANHGDGTVAPLDISGGAGRASGADASTLTTPIRVGRRPVAIAITPDGKMAYVANHGDDAVTPIGLPIGVVGAPIRVGRRPHAIAVAPDGRMAYVANHGDGTVTPISLPAGTPGTPIKVGRRPWAIAIMRSP